ncbi:MAG: outer membrane beta-barrel protein [Sphingobacteriaceae bacterium]|nr:outer membrane beta-barrel protein [Sphingobacteriaceae bacterium]
MIRGIIKAIVKDKFLVISKSKRQNNVKLKFSGFLLIIFLFFSTISFGQTWEFGGFVGTAGYMGDLNPINPVKVNNLAFGAQIKRNFDGYWSLKLNAAHGKVEAADSKSDNKQFRNRNLSFFSPVTELSLQTEFNFFRYIPSISKKIYSPYLFIGVGVVSFNPQTTFEGNVYQLTDYPTEGQKYNTLALSMPLGAGVKYNFSGKWTLGAEIGYRTAYTDYIDDVSTVYLAERLDNPDKPNDSAMARLLSDRSFQVGEPEHRSGTQRGDYRKNDTYLFLGFTISYTLFNIKCPVVDD